MADLNLSFVLVSIYHPRADELLDSYISNNAFFLCKMGITCSSGGNKKFILGWSLWFCPFRIAGNTLKFLSTFWCIFYLGSKNGP